MQITPSGSGKSTLLNILGCLYIPTRGTYLLNGTYVATLTDAGRAAVRGREIGFVFQQFHLGAGFWIVSRPARNFIAFCLETLLIKLVNNFLDTQKYKFEGAVSARSNSLTFFVKCGIVLVAARSCS